MRKPTRSNARVLERVGNLKFCHTYLMGRRWHTSFVHVWEPPLLEHKLPQPGCSFPPRASLWISALYSQEANSSLSHYNHVGRHPSARGHTPRDNLLLRLRDTQALMPKSRTMLFWLWSTARLFLGLWPNVICSCNHSTRAPMSLTACIWEFGTSHSTGRKPPCKVASVETYRP